MRRKSFASIVTKFSSTPFLVGIGNISAPSIVSSLNSDFSYLKTRPFSASNSISVTDFGSCFNKSIINEGSTKNFFSSVSSKTKLFGGILVITDIPSFIPTREIPEFLISTRVLDVISAFFEIPFFAICSAASNNFLSIFIIKFSFNFL